MGVAIKEILKEKYFKNYKVIAGEKGVGREIQAVAVYDAPDGYKWFKGKELVLSTGYLYQGNTDSFLEVIKFLHDHDSAGLGIKKDRYLHVIPNEVINLCNELNFPLISIPFDEAWIDVINAVNSIAVNKFITKINEKNEDDGIVSPNSLWKKINEIIWKLGAEIGKPITISQSLNNKCMTYPQSYSHDILTTPCKIKDDYDFSYSKEIVCDKLNIHRFSVVKDSLCPWLVIPIQLRNIKVANIIIWEENGKIDYYDLLALRIAATLVTEIYEQLYLFQNFEGRYFDDFIKKLVSGELGTYSEVEEFVVGIRKMKINIDSSYIVTTIKAEDENTNFYSHRDKIYHSVLAHVKSCNNIFGIVNQDTIVVITDTKGMIQASHVISKMFNTIIKNLVDCFHTESFRIGIGSEVNEILGIKRSYIESLKALEVGKYLFRNKKTIPFDELGPFGLLRLENLQQRDFGNVFNKI